MALDTTVIPSLRQVIYDTYASFPTAGLTVGDLAWATDLKCLYRWSGSAWDPVVAAAISDAFASFPAAHIPVGVIAWATDRKCAYRWNGTAWETIGISSRHGNYADIGNPANYPESSLYQADDQTLLYMIVSGAWQQITFAQGLPPFEPGDIVAIANDPYTQTQEITYTKLKEIQIATGGTIRISFDLQTNGGSYTAYGRIYKNGVAVGTQRSTTSTTYVTFSEDLAGFSAGDLVQLYGKQQSASYICFVRNFRLKANKGHMHNNTLV
jgi:hypothetical protein